jgi:hypothetical protein
MRLMNRTMLVLSFAATTLLPAQERVQKTETAPDPAVLESLAPRAAIQGGSPSDAPRRPSGVVADAADSGTNGDVIMTSPSPYTSTGVLLQAKPSWPYVVAKTGSADAWSAFAVTNSLNAELFRVRSDGYVGIGTNAPGARLHVNGSEVLISNRPASGQVESVTLLTLSNRAASGNDYAWRFATAGSDGGSGVYSNGLEVYEYPGNPQMYCCYRRISVRPITNNNAKVFVIDGDGNVGIGVWAPGHALHVSGNGRIEGSLTVTGDITGARVINATYRDVAEWVSSDENLTDGSVVTISSDKDDHVVASREAYDTRVAGVVSPEPGVLLGEPGASRYKIATTGRVRVKVDATRGAIRKGDLLVSSGTPGVAMKSQPVDVAGVQMHRPGTLIGKALESLESGTGEILVLLSLQ